MIAFIAL
jgi:hypothetical protein